MSLIDLASMVLAPTAVKDGKVYNAIPNDQDFTFSRGTEATRVNSAGLIEKARTNRLLQSNNFNTTWGTGFSTLTSGQVGYDGTNDAWKIESTTIGGETRIRQSQTFTTGEVISLSVYMKKGNVNFGIVRTYAITGGGRAWFDLENGTVETENSGINGSIKDVGNGWYRCSIWGVITTTGAVDIAPAPADGDYLADAVGEFIYIQDSQLESGLVSTDVITTTTSSVTVGITDNLPRVDYSGGGCPSLLLEGSRTNLVTHSEYFAGGGWANVGTTITTNATTSPSGNNDATLIVSSSGGSSRVQDYFGALSGNHSYSLFVKAYTTSTRLNIATNDNGSLVLTVPTSGTPTVYAQGPANTSYFINELSNGWYYVGFTFLPSGATNYFQIYPDASAQGGGVYVWGAQCESGSYSTSYIPTYGTSTSRSADSCSLSNASNLFNNDTAVWLIDIERIGIDSTDIGDSLTLKDGSNVRQITLWFDAPTEQIRFRDGKNSFTTIGSSGGVIGTPAGERKKIALKIDGTTLKVFADGVQKGSNYTRPTAFDFTKMDMTGIGYKIKNVQFYTTALTDAQVIELTK